MAGDDKEQDGESAESSFFESPPKASTFAEDVARVGRRPETNWRSPLLMVVLVGACVWLGLGLMPDVRYFFERPVPVDLGKAGSLDLSHARPNAYVHLEGIPSVLKVSYEQFGHHYEVYYLLGSRVFVRQRLVKKKRKPGDDTWSVYDGAGRLVDLDRSAEYANVKRFYAARGFSFREPTWMVLSGVEPRQAWWYPAAIVVLALVAAFNLLLLFRRVVRRR